MTIDLELLRTISEIEDLNELGAFFDEILTLGEVADLSLRWKLLIDLHSGITQRKIAQTYGISLCKITRGSKILKKRSSVILNILEKKK